jgi:hypothetical protein
MQAPPHREQVMQSSRCGLIGNFMERNQGESLRAEGSWILKTKIEVQFGLLPFAVVPLFAGNLASAASDALRDVD